MITDINRYGQFYGGNNLVVSGTEVCSEPRLYPNNAYYRFNKLRDEGDWPSHISGIYYGKGDCINCPKSDLKNFADFSWKNFGIDNLTNQELLQKNKITDIHRFLMLNSKVGSADIRYKFLGPVFQRLIVGYQVFWPMQGYQNPTDKFNTNYVSSDSFPRAVGGVSSPTAAEKTGIGEWANEYDGETVQPWGAMKRKIMGDYQAPSISQITKTNMGAWYWPQKNNSFQWYINSNFNGPPKISGFESGLNKKFSELRIIFDSCSVSNIENRVRVPCPSPGSHIFAGKSSLAGSNSKYRFQMLDFDNEGNVACFIEYFALLFTDKEKDSLNPIQLGIVEAKSGYNFYDVTNTSTFNDLLNQYGLSIQGGDNVSGMADIEITGCGWPRGVNINLCSSDYFNSNLNHFMRSEMGKNPDTFDQIACTRGDSIYSPNFDVFSGVNVASGLVHLWSERQGLWTSGHYLDPPFYIGGFLRMADAEYFSQISNNGFEVLSPGGIQSYYLGPVKEPKAGFPVGDYYISNNPFYPVDVDGDGDSYYAFSQDYTGWFCKYFPCGSCGDPLDPDPYYIENRGYIEGKWIYFINSEFGKLIVPHRPLYFVHGFAGALLTPYDYGAPGGGYYCGERSYPFLNKLNECNLPSTDYFLRTPTNNQTFYFGLGSSYDSFASHFHKISIAGYLEEPSLES